MTVAIEVKLQKLLEKRTANGAAFYVGLWLLMGFVTDIADYSPILFYSVASFLIALAVSRKFCYQQSDKIRSYNKHLWHLAFLFNSLIPPLVFGCLFALSMHPSYSELFTYLLMIILAILGGGSVTFSPCIKLTSMFIAVLSFPGIASAFIFASGRETEGFMLFLYALFIFSQSRILNQEYQERVQQRQELELLTRTDSLTQIFNRRFFDDSFRIHWKTHQRKSAALGLILIDIDHFKKINDVYGHPVGDEVIRRVASTIQNIFQRETDVVARVGGEEFAVLMPGADVETVQQMSGDIHRQISKVPLHIEAKEIAVTVSVGAVVEVPDKGSSFSDLYKQADDCLYQAKEMGRDRVVFRRSVSVNKKLT